MNVINFHHTNDTQDNFEWVEKWEQIKTSTNQVEAEQLSVVWCTLDVLLLFYCSYFIRRPLH